VVRLLVGASILPLSTDDPSASTAAPESGFLRQPKPSEMRTGAQNRIRVRPSQLFFSVEYAGCWFIVTPVKKTSPYAEENQQNTVRRTDHTVSYWAGCDCDR
jgi:hypothetical protein